MHEEVAVAANEDEAREPDNPGEELDPASLEDDRSDIVVEVEPGLALVFGGSTYEELGEIIPLGLLGGQSMNELTSAVSKSVGYGNLATQIANGTIPPPGLVRLAPETLEALKTAVPATKDGWNIGVLVKDGKFAHSVRWLPASSAGVLSVIAAAGPAVAMIAIQTQLAAITRLGEHNLELTGQLMQTFRNQHWAQVEGRHKKLAGEIENALHIGVVVDEIWSGVLGLDSELEADLQFFAKEISGHVTSMQSKLSNSERQEFIADHGYAILADAHAMIVSHASWSMYQALRAGHLLITAEQDSTAESLLKKLAADIPDRNDELRKQTQWLLEQVHREFSIMVELDGRRTFPFGGERKSGKAVADAAARLRKTLATLQGEGASTEFPLPQMPSIQVPEGSCTDDFRRLLRYRLDHGERLVAVADVRLSKSSKLELVADIAGAVENSIKGSRWLDSWAVLTNKRLLVMNKKEFRRCVGISTDISLHTIRIVQSEDWNPYLRVFSTDARLVLRFSASPSGVAQFQRAILKYSPNAKSMTDLLREGKNRRRELET